MCLFFFAVFSCVFFIWRGLACFKKRKEKKRKWFVSFLNSISRRRRTRRKKKNHLFQELKGLLVSRTAQRNGFKNCLFQEFKEKTCFLVLLFRKEKKTPVLWTEEHLLFLTTALFICFKNGLFPKEVEEKHQTNNFLFICFKKRRICFQKK